MSDRNGATLIEVLVAIFVMGIGLLALLTLFPLGVLRMAQAIQDERCAQCSRIATGTASFQGVSFPGLAFAGATSLQSITVPAGTSFLAGLRNDVYVVNASDPTPVTLSSSFDAFSAALPGPTLTPDPDGPSFPVFVDPLGYNQTAGLPSQGWLTLAGSTVGTIRRRTTSFVQSAPAPASPSTAAYRWFSLLDDYIFALDPVGATGEVPFGTPEWLSGTNSFNRDTRYSWAYMLKRPRTADRSVVDLTVCVFKNRAISATTGMLSEFLYQTGGPSNLQEVTMHPLENTIKIDVTTSGNALPPARPGDWLLDASYVPNPAGTYATVNGYFYRVVGVTENTATSYTYEVQQPLRNFPATGYTVFSTPAAPVATAAWQKIIYLDGLVAVYEKGAGKLP